MKIGKFKFTKNSPPYIIAEAGVNHNGSYELAVRLVDEAAAAGAHAIKWQIYSAGKLCTRTAPRFWEWEGEIKQNGTQYDSYAELDKFPLEEYRRLAKYCRERGIEFLATPFDEEAVEFLESIKVAAYKVASCDCSNIPFLKYIARQQKPVLLSTGASSLEDIDEAVAAIEGEGNRQIVVLHCILKYPTPPEHANLEMIRTLKQRYARYPVGFSDHTLGVRCTLAAIACGAEVIEKHYTVDKKLPLSADHWLSVDPPELKEIVDGSAEIKQAMGQPWARPLPIELPTFLNARRSVVANRDIAMGTVIVAGMLTCKRPGTGLHPRHLESLIGKKARRDLREDDLVKIEDFV